LTVPARGAPLRPQVGTKEIYQWRGSDVGNILTFAQRYKPVQTIKLEANFRSTPGITDVARIVIEKNSVRLTSSTIPIL
jgi:superfamily I DNA/RNA helicase